MKTTSLDLFHLIKSLSPQEQKEFIILNIKTKKDKKYILLFQLITQQTTYDEPSIQEHSFKKLSKNEFSTLKKYTLNKINQFLLYQNNQERNRYDELLSGIQLIRIYERKGLIEEALKLTYKHQIKAEQYQYFGLTFELFKLEQRLTNKTKNSKTLKHCVNSYQTAKKALLQQENHLEHSYQSLLYYSNTVTSEHRPVPDLFKTPNHNNVWSELLYLNISKADTQNLIRFIDKYPFIVDEFPNNFISIYRNLSINAITSRELEQAKNYLKPIEKLKNNPYALSSYYILLLQIQTIEHKYTQIINYYQKKFNQLHLCSDDYCDALLLVLNAYYQKKEYDLFLDNFKKSASEFQETSLDSQILFRLVRFFIAVESSQIEVIDIQLKVLYYLVSSEFQELQKPLENLMEKSISFIKTSKDFQELKAFYETLIYH